MSVQSMPELADVEIATASLTSSYKTELVVVATTNGNSSFVPAETSAEHVPTNERKHMSRSNNNKTATSRSIPSTGMKFDETTNDKLDVLLPSRQQQQKRVKSEEPSSKTTTTRDKKPSYNTTLKRFSSSSKTRSSRENTNSSNDCCVLAAPPLEEETTDHSESVDLSPQKAFRTKHFNNNNYYYNNASLVTAKKIPQAQLIVTDADAAATVIVKANGQAGGEPSIPVATPMPKGSNTKRKRLSRHQCLVVLVIAVVVVVAIVVGVAVGVASRISRAPHQTTPLSSSTTFVSKAPSLSPAGVPLRSTNSPSYYNESKTITPTNRSSDDSNNNSTLMPTLSVATGIRPSQSPSSLNNDRSTGMPIPDATLFPPVDNQRRSPTMPPSAVHANNTSTTPSMAVPRPSQPPQQRPTRLRRNDTTTTSTDTPTTSVVLDSTLGPTIFAGKFRAPTTSPSLG